MDMPEEEEDTSISKPCVLRFLHSSVFSLLVVFLLTTVVIVIVYAFVVYI